MLACSLDLDELLGWYELQEEGLDERILDKIAKTITLIQEHPLMFTEKEFGQRSARIGSPFLYEIYYFYNQNSKEVVINAILHEGRNPKLNMERKLELDDLQNHIRMKELIVIKNRLEQLETLRKKNEIDLDGPDLFR